MTQILTPIFHALSGGETEPGRPEPRVDFEQDPLAAPLPAAALQDAEQRKFDQPTEKRSALQVVAGRAAGGAHRARSTSPTTRSYSSRAGFHSRPAQSGADALGSTGTGAHRAPEDEGVAGSGFVVHGTPVSAGRVAESGSHHAVSRTGGRHRTLRAVSH
ncbi:MAG TPA: hypothetical protein VL595_00195 [Pseudonocardia sp.]|nr:hypothetical protein [Pseudonocardia sp.]